ncbi:hypothetical protein [Faucicola boevrei]|uniref:hypothetical protein n=1 Tax=Faucicola boevrei TaxID=346665 RepID=UPI0003603C0F|nr:hypothetical protein [Moraxella boevrei]
MDSTIQFNTAELDLLLNALQTWKDHTERNLSKRSEQGWDNTEQTERIQAVEALVERIFAHYPHSY